MKCKFLRTFLPLVLAGMLFLPRSAAAESSLMDMSLEDLMSLTVTSMSKRAQTVQQTPAATSVITAEDIRRSGARSVPEALRLVPGLMVARNSADAWSVASRGRGYNSSFESRLLVLVDGRSIYSPLFNNVFWDNLDLVMEDIERIEVIRGPGSSVWGANAVNGIVNIITKSTLDTKGLLVAGEYGTDGDRSGLARYGDRIGDTDNTWRVYGKYSNLQPLEDEDGRDAHDGRENGVMGFRTDLVPDEDSSLTLQGDLYLSRHVGSQTYPDLLSASMVTENTRTSVNQGNVLGKYTRNLTPDSSLSLQASHSRENWDGNLETLSYQVTDLDLQYQFLPWENHLAQIGLGYRRSDINGETSATGLFFPQDSLGSNLYSAFIQDEISLADGQWVLTLGSKFERNDFTGLEFLPSARLLWNATPDHIFWGAVSRSVRTPSIAEEYMIYHLSVDTYTMPAPFPTLPLRTTLISNKDLEAESSLVWELGYRYVPSANFSVDTAFFLTRADNILSAGYDPAKITMMMNPVPYYQLYAVMGNHVSGTSYGLEISSRWKPARWLTLSGWYSYCESEYDLHDVDDDILYNAYGQSDSRHQFFFRASLDLQHDTELDVMTRYVSELPGLDVPDYASLDARLGWHITDQMEISLTGNNLLSNRHTESNNNMAYGSSGFLEPSCLLKVQMKF